MKAPGLVSRAWTRSFVAASKTVSKFLESRTSSVWNCSPNALAAACVSFLVASAPGLDEPQRKATRVIFGTTYFSSSSLFPPNSGASTLSPVTFPPGIARLPTSPLATGS